MQKNDVTISSESQERLAENFEHIIFLINNNRIPEAREQLLELHYADLADFLDNTNHRLYEVIVPSLASELNPETIVSLSDSSKQPVLEVLGITKTTEIINEMDIEDAIEVVDELDEEFKQQLLDAIQVEKKHQILEGFNYPENTVGRVLERDYIAFQAHWTVGQAIDFIKRSNPKNDFHAAVIVNSRFKPVGNILLSTLLKNQRNISIKELMNSEFKVADVFTELNDLVFIFKQYALTIVPIINKAGKLVGTVSINNMIYIIEEQTESEFMQLGGVSTRDIFDGLFETSKQRFPWLFVNLVTACITSLIIAEFSGTISQLITLAAVMPIVAALCGSVGTQVMTVTVRAIANREVMQANANRLIVKEMFVCLLNGVLIAIIGAILTYALFDDFSISIIFVISILVNFFVAGLLGSGIPIALNALDLDPATASGVFVTAFTDALAFFSFLGLAYVLIV